MKTFVFAAVAAVAAAFASPAMAADFVGPRLEVTAGADDVVGGVDTTDITYGAAVGFDVSPVKNVIVGIEADANNIADRRDVGVAARAGYVVADDVLFYGKVGYANWKQTTSRALEGLRVGGGVEVNVTGPVFVKAEYRYTDFDKGVGKHGGLVGVGLRF